MRWQEILRRALGGEQNLPPFRGGHSSPHRFDQFDASRIGTGEGAQTFGYGLYAAEHPEIYGEHYRRTLARPDVTVGGQRAYEFLQPYTDDLDMRVAARTLYDDLRQNQYTERGLEYILRGWDRALQGEDPNSVWAAGIRRQRDLLTDWRTRGITNDPGINTYELNLHLNPDRVLIQDLPFDEQSRFVQDALGEFDYMQTMPNVAGGLRRMRQDIIDDTLADRGLPVDIPRAGELPYEQNMDYLRQRRVITQDANPRISQALQERGIQGQLYFDEHSRLGAADPTFNMVVHPGEESRIEILRRWGLLPFAGVSAYDALGGEQ